MIKYNYSFNGVKDSIMLYERKITNPEIVQHISKYLFIRKDGITYRHPLCDHTLESPTGWQKNKVTVKLNGIIYTGISPMDPKYKVTMEEDN